MKHWVTKKLCINVALVGLILLGCLVWWMRPVPHLEPRVDSISVEQTFITPPTPSQRQSSNTPSKPAIVEDAQPGHNLDHLFQRTCGSPAVDGYTHVDPNCLINSPTARWYKEHVGSTVPHDKMVAHIEFNADYDGLAVVSLLEMIVVPSKLYIFILPPNCCIGQSCQSADCSTPAPSPHANALDHFCYLMFCVLRHV